jgi:hypothetical protein
MVALAMRVGATPSDQKANLTTLYEVGLLPAETLALAIAHFQLGEA